MIFEHLKSDLDVSDEDFDSIYPDDIKPLAEFHFTPAAVAKLAAQYLVGKPGTKVLDIGSGGGKFCIIGASCTDGHFTGVEQREYLYLVSNRIVDLYRLQNIKFIKSNILEIKFSNFDSFYYFNSFYEHIDKSAVMDDTIHLDVQLYHYYASYVKEQLNGMPVGTKLVTYFSYLDEIPVSYKIRSTDMDGKLKMWEKTS